MKYRLRILVLWFPFISACFQPVTGHELPTANPEDVGLSSGRLEKIDKFIQDLVDKELIAGSIGLAAKKGKMVYSMTKPITSVAVMILYEEGHFLLNDPVSKYIPEFDKKFKLFIYQSIID
jgi:hypothetical protein